MDVVRVDKHSTSGQLQSQRFLFLVLQRVAQPFHTLVQAFSFRSTGLRCELKFVEFVRGQNSQLEDFQAHLENLECPILQLVQPESTVNLGHAHRTLNILRTIRFCYDNVCFTDFNQIRLLDVEVVPVYWPEPQAPRLSALPLPTLTQAQFC